eukprot:9790-Heterococcus_DN1.PRE.5
MHSMRDEAYSRTSCSAQHTIPQPASSCQSMTITRGCAVAAALPIVLYVNAGNWQNTAQCSP